MINTTKIFICAGFLLLAIAHEQLEAQSEIQQDSISSNQFFIGASYGKDVSLTFIGKSDFFAFDLSGYDLFGVEVGMLRKKIKYSLFYQSGENIIQKNMAKHGGFDGEIEINEMFETGIQFRRNEKEFNLMGANFTIGSRFSLSYIQFKGNKFSHTEEYNYSEEGTLTRHTEHNAAFSGGFNFGIGNITQPGTTGFSLIIEPLALRFSLKDIGIHALNTRLLFGF
jgi:hypothetical protein